eukprot:gene18864-25723_t
MRDERSTGEMVKDGILSRIPILKWLPNYNRSMLQWCILPEDIQQCCPMLPAAPRAASSDVVAGLTVGLMVVPQSLAYAKSIAGLPIQ